MSSPTPALSIRGVEKSFGDVRALRGIDLEVAPGEVVGLLGPNGAGKTTLVRIVATLITPDAGEVAVCGHDSVTAPGLARENLGLAGQFASVDELLTGRENLEMIGRLYGLSRSDAGRRAADLLTGLGLAASGHRRAGTYSGGMRRRLDLGATLMGQPALLLLDEPTTGLDPRSRLGIWSMVEQIAAHGTAILVTSQNLDEVDRLADRVVVIDDGSVIADGRPRELRRRIGGHVVDLRFDGLDHDDGSDAGLHAIAGALGEHGPRLHRDGGSGRVDGVAMGTLDDTLRTVRRLMDAGVEPTELAYRVPSLEEAFLTLTGAGSDPDGSGGGVPDADDEIVGKLPEPATLGATRSPLRDATVVVARDLKRMTRTPESVFFALVMPVMFVLGLSAVFGDLVAAVIGEDYVQFLVPGAVVMQLALFAGATGVGLATDLRDGIVDRFRSLPMASLAVLAGRTTTDLIRNALAVLVMVLAGVAVGFRFEGGPGGAVAALAVALLFGYALTWIFAAVGLAVRDPQTANFVGFAPVLLFVYLSSAWVPIDTMSGAVRGFARHQPVNVTIEAVRALVNGDPTGDLVVRSALWSVGLIVIFGSLAARQFRTATT